MRKLQKRTKPAPGPQKQARFVYTFKIGWFTALNIKLEEVAINEVVLRVPLPPERKVHGKQNRSTVSSKKSIVSSSVNRKRIKKSGGRLLKNDKNSLSKQQNPRKRPAQQSSVSSPVNDGSVKTSKRRCLTANDSQTSSSKQTKLGNSSKDSLELHAVDGESGKKLKRWSLAVSGRKESLSKQQSPLKSPSKQFFDSKPNCEPVKEPKSHHLVVNVSKDSLSKQQNPPKNPSKRRILTVNGSKNSSIKQRPSLSASGQLSSKTTHREVKSAFRNGQEAVATYGVKKDENFANKLRQKLKELVHSPSLSKSQTKLTVDFTKLSDLVLHMNLPSAEWRVTVLMNRDLSLVFEFTNKNASKYVRFAETNPHCNIVVSGKSVILLGCPKTVDCLKDIEILLEIVDELDLQDCMIITS